MSNVAQIVDNYLSGKMAIASFRKVVPSTATITNQWFDYSTATGMPVANYYASSPLTAATLDSDKGIYLPSIDQRLLKLDIMTAASGVAVTSNQNQMIMLLDYLIYYPFIDLDAAGDVQLMDNSVTLPRYEDGVGVEMMMVSQATTTGGGNFTVTYIGDDDVEYTTNTINCAAAQPSGALVQSIASTTGLTAFLPKAAGLRGVKSIVSVTMGSANGGLAAIVLVKPIQTTYCREECRRPTASPTESFGDAAQVLSITQRAGAEEIKSGAFLGFIGLGAGGSLASSILTGILETVWE